jgi:hypothetical protein
MARTAINYQQIARTGLETAYSAAVADGGKFSNDGRMFLHVKNGAGAPINVTIQTPGTVDGLAVAEQVVAVTNAEERMIGPFPPNIYNQTDGMVYVDYSAVTDVTVALLRL